MQSATLCTPARMTKLYFASLFWALVCLVRFDAAAGLVLNEFMAANTGGLLDQDGDSSDWIEIHNDSTAQATLAGWHLTDTAGNLTKWTFPATNFPAGRCRTLPTGDVSPSLAVVRLVVD